MARRRNGAETGRAQVEMWRSGTRVNVIRTGPVPRRQLPAESSAQPAVGQRGGVTCRTALRQDDRLCVLLVCDPCASVKRGGKRVRLLENGCRCAVPAGRTVLQQTAKTAVGSPEWLMKKSEVLHAWGNILSGRAPSLSIEITKECPLRCPGCYAFDAAHLGGETDAAPAFRLQGRGAGAPRA